MERGTKISFLLLQDVWGGPYTRLNGRASQLAGIDDPRQLDPAEAATVLGKNGQNNANGANGSDRYNIVEKCIAAIVTLALGIGIPALIGILWTVHGDILELHASTMRLETGQKDLKGDIRLVKDTIVELHKGNSKDVPTLYKLLQPADTKAQVMPKSVLPFRVEAKDIALETGHIPGTIALNVLSAKQGEFVDVLATRGGTVLRVGQHDELISDRKPDLGHREFTTITIRHEDGTVMEYSRLMTEEPAIKEHAVVIAGQTIGRAQAYSPVCLRLCLKFSEGGSCVDPRSLFPDISVVPPGGRLSRTLDNRQPA